jgi:hypothetical protein
MVASATMGQYDPFGMPHFRKSSYTSHEFHDGKHRFEHWYRDNTVYFITARCRDKFPAFDSVPAKAIFWDRFDHYSKQFGFVPWVTSLLNNHYHTIGYLKVGENLGPFVQRVHGSVAKLVNDVLPVRHLPFWRRAGNQDYFDGCIRDVLQARRAYRYTLRQSVWHKLCTDHASYPDTRVNVDIDRAVKRAVELNAFLEDIPYARYERHRARRHGR